VINLGSVNLTQIFTSNIFGAGYRPNYLYACDVNSCVVFFNPGAVAVFGNYVNLFVVDISGNYTWYVIYAGGSTIQNVVPYGKGSFAVVLYNGQTFFIQVANSKINNTSPIVLSNKVFPFTNPCGINGSNKVFVDAYTGLIAVGMYSDAGQYGGPVYATVGKMTSKGITGIVSQGIAGVASSNPAYDPFDKTSYSTTVNYMSNGVLASFNRLPSGYTSLGQELIGIHVGGFAGCNTVDGVTGTYVYDRAVNVIATGAVYPYGKFVDSTIKGIVSILYSPVYPNYFIEGYSGSFAAILEVLTTGYLTCALVTPSTIFVGGSNAANKPAIFMAANPGFVSGYSLFGRRAYPLINSVRPISLSGAYKT
jgi:hypothetical protein